MPNHSSAEQLDQTHVFKGVTITVKQVKNVKLHDLHLTQKGYFYVSLKIGAQDSSTNYKQNHTQRHKINTQKTTFNEGFFYNTSEGNIDDDMRFELFYDNDIYDQQFGQQRGSSIRLVDTSSIKRSKLSDSKQVERVIKDKIVGASETIQLSRKDKNIQTETLTLINPQTKKVIGQIIINYQLLNRQDVVGGIKCPNLSLAPEKELVRGSKMALQNKYTAYKNLYSFWDGYQDQQCEFFPKKFKN